jgi:hypothetical protein
LLDDVGEFVRQNRSSAIGARPVLSFTKDDVIAHRVGQRADRSCGFSGFATGVHANVAKVASETRFKEVSLRLRQPLSAACRVIEFGTKLMRICERLALQFLFFARRTLPLNRRRFTTLPSGLRNRIPHSHHSLRYVIGLLLVPIVRFADCQFSLHESGPKLLLRRLITHRDLRSAAREWARQMATASSILHALVCSTLFSH